MKPASKQPKRNKALPNIRRVLVAWLDHAEPKRVAQAQRIEQMSFRKRREDSRWAKGLAKRDTRSALMERRIEREALAHHQLAAKTALDSVGVRRDGKGMEQRRAVYAASKPLLEHLPSVLDGTANQATRNQVARTRERIAAIIGKARTDVFVRKYVHEMRKNIDIHNQIMDPFNVENGRLRKRGKR